MNSLPLIMGTAILLLTISATILISKSRKPLSREEAFTKIQTALDKKINRNKNLHNGILRIDSAELKFSKTFTCGKSHNKPVENDHLFHTASIGKIFTATIINMLAEKNMLKLDDPISDYLAPGLLDGLFVVEGIDYQNDVTIYQLLQHTSGIADYFEDPALSGANFRKLIPSQPQRFWKPLDLIDFTRSNQRALTAPGKKMHYSDTGYILLGLIIEAVSGKTYHDALHTMIFEPLNMKDTYLMFYPSPNDRNQAIGELYFDTKEISNYKSLSADWSGGGLISTVADLCKFSIALNSYQLVRQETLKTMYTFNQKHMRGIHYGLGVMEYRFGEFFPTLRHLATVTGHMGVFGTQMVYDKKTKTAIALSLGSTHGTSKSVQLLIGIMSILSRIKD